MIKTFFKYFSVVAIFFAIQIFAGADVTFRGYQPISLVKGSFLKAINLREVSTDTAKIGDSVYFINPSDVFIGETNVIPKDSIYQGVVESIIEPLEGINAAMKIKIVKLITTNKIEYNMDAYVMWKGTTTIGGDLSQVQYYARMPHYSTMCPKGYLQLVPTTLRYPGEPRGLRAGEEVTFVMNSDVPLYRN